MAVVGGATLRLFRGDPPCSSSASYSIHRPWLLMLADFALAAHGCRSSPPSRTGLARFTAARVRRADYGRSGSPASSLSLLSDCVRDGALAADPCGNRDAFRCAVCRRGLSGGSSSRRHRRASAICTIFCVIGSRSFANVGAHQSLRHRQLDTACGGPRSAPAAGDQGHELAANLLLTLAPTISTSNLNAEECDAGTFPLGRYEPSAPHKNTMDALERSQSGTRRCDANAVGFRSFLFLRLGDGAERHDFSSGADEFVVRGQFLLLGCCPTITTNAASPMA